MRACWFYADLFKAVIEMIQRTEPTEPASEESEYANSPEFVVPLGVHDAVHTIGNGVHQFTFPFVKPMA
jgi:hypothetical protein